MDGHDHPPPVQLVSIADPEHLAAALRDAQVEYLRLAPEPFTAALTAINLGPIRLQVASDQAHLSRGQVAADQSMLLFGIDLPQGQTLMNGAQVNTGDVLHLGPGAPLFARVRGPVRWAACSFRHDLLHAATPEAPLPLDGDFRLSRNNRGHAALARFAAIAASLAARDPLRFALPSVRQAMAEDAVRLSLAVTGQPMRQDSSLRAVQRRVALVSRAEEVLAATMSTPLYSEDLQQALGVPMRTLHNAFVAVHGMSAHRYLRLRRLHLARAALRARPRTASHVKVAALNHGFWHLGRFAQDYRDLFGELPSETIALGHSALLSGR